MLNKLFNPENGFWRLMSILMDILAFSLIWIVCGATVVLLGPGTTALYDAMARCLGKGETGGYQRFWTSLKANFKVGCPAGLVVAIIGYGLVKLHGLLYAGAVAGNRTMFVLYIAFWGGFVAICGMVAYIFPVLSRFEFQLGGLLSTSARLALSHPGTTLLLGLVTGLCIMLCVLFWLPGLVLPYAWAWLASLLLERVFKPYMEEQGEQPDG